MNRSRAGRYLSFLLLATPLVAVRVALVLSGWLYGTARVAIVDVALGIALVLLMAWRLRGTEPPAGSSFHERVGTIVAILGIPALVTTLLNVVAPATPQTLSKPACAGAPTRGAPFVGITVGELGNFARSGPGVSFPQNDRFDKDCTIGFDGYCIGSAVEDAVVRREWMETRWLRVFSHGTEPARTAARLVSGETRDTRFVAMANVGPKSPDKNLTWLGAKACPGGRDQPGKPRIAASETAVNGVVSLKAVADHAERIGVAISIPQASISQGSAIRKVEAVPTDAGGGAPVAWKAGNTLKGLKAPRSRPITIDVLAVACLGPVAPAAEFGTVSYEVSPNGTVKRAAKPHDVGAAADGLRRAACDPD